MKKGIIILLVFSLGGEEEEVLSGTGSGKVRYRYYLVIPVGIIPGKVPGIYL